MKQRLLLIILLYLSAGILPLFAEDNPETKKPVSTPLILNGDRVEYATDNKNVTITGGVEVNYKGAKLTCDKLLMDTQSKEGTAEGNARLDDAQGVIEGTKIIYNFETKRGTIFDTKFRVNPYFGTARKMEKLGDTEFVAYRSYVTTCNLDHPHYRIGSNKVNVFPDDKIQTQGNTIYAGNIPILYLTRYNQSLKDPLMHVQVTPGKSKEWGGFVLSEWRYNLSQYVDGRAYFDVRQKLGLAGGAGANYRTPDFGKGDYKFYYSKEMPDNLPDILPEGVPRRFDRYLIRLRHKWDIDPQTNLMAEFYKIYDQKRKLYDATADFLKDYFYREYEKNTQPLTYAQLHHAFSYSSMDFYIQNRTNHWFNQLNVLPQVSYSLPSIQMWQAGSRAPIYFANNTALAIFNRKATVQEPSSNQDDVTRLDTTNRISFPTKVAFISFEPYVSSEQTFYDKGADGETLPIRTIFSSGANMSTKFYRIFNIKSKFFDINGLRHVITPSIGYSYKNQPTIPDSKLKQIDSVDTATGNNSATLELSNKLQTKRDGVSVDVVNFLVGTPYIFKPKTGDKRGSYLSDINFKLEITPYSWLRFVGDTTYKHSGSSSDENYGKFVTANYDVDFNFSEERTFGFGQSYDRNGSKQLTYSFIWRLNPKWKFAFYQRREKGRAFGINRGLKEQEFTITRDLHCWSVDMNYNGTKGKGSTIWLIFRLKAFPGIEFEYNQQYHAPKPGEQRMQ